jgi:hypothetical protein
VSAEKSSHCIFDIMMYTKLSGYFIHIEKGEYTIKKFNNNLFFTKKQLEKFFSIINKYKDINKIFVFAGHCNGMYCYCDKTIVNFNMIYKLFKKHKCYFDLICFDACYTSTLEMIYQFHDITNNMLVHQTYVNAEGFNSPNLSKLFDKNININSKILNVAKEYIKRSLTEEGHASVSIIDCNKLKDFLIEYKKNYNIIRQVILSNKVKKYYTDLCTKWLTNCEDCSETICNNMLDLHKVLKLVGNKELYKLLDNSVIYLENGVPLDKKYFNKIKLGGINVIINPKIKDYKKHYKKLRFYKEFNV